MAPNSLSPASVKINYHTVYGAHSMTIPTLEWFATSITGNLGSYVGHTGSPLDAEVMVNALVDTLKVFMKPSTSFDLATVYTQATPTSDNIPRASVALTQVGTSAATTEEQAVSFTFNFKTTCNGDAKIVLLDAPIGSNWFRKQLPAAFSASVLAVESAFCLSASAWSGRDDCQPTVLRSVTFDLNDKLQKQYKM